MFCNSTFVGVEMRDTDTHHSQTVEVSARGVTSTPERTYDIGLRIGGQQRILLSPQLSHEDAFEGVQVDMSSFSLLFAGNTLEFDTPGILTELITQTAEVVVTGDRESGTILVTLAYLGKELTAVVLFDPKYFQWKD